MPRTTKDVAKSTAKKKDADVEVKKVTKKTTTKKDDTSSKKTKTVATKKESATPKTKTVAPKKESVTKKATNTSKKASASSSKKATSSKEKANTTKKGTAVSQVSKNSATSASTNAKSKTSTTKKSSSTKKKATSSKAKKVEIFEYYDLPYRYNQTTVKVLAQTPEMLFVYWDISDEDRLLYTTKFGEDFFSKTRPVLLVHNTTMNYTFEIEINDFANSWYLHVNDAGCEYVIELGRRPNLYQDTVKEPYIYVASSNQMEAPNDHILFERFHPNIAYRNVKTGQMTMKDFSHLSNFKNMQEIYGIYDLYKQIYQNELFDELIDGNVTNPSSLSSSSFK